MSYQVLARKWRPRTFDQMVGQQHVLRALTNALDQGRVHHAFLFTGTRGVGKTTVARVFAKALNCDVAVSSQPCGECEACQAIDEGRFVDLIEVDAASRTRVDDTRELLDNVQYAPTGGRYKVYLIDEVHMLSAHSFNALLKTLEEPPPHVKFLLATTDPQKLPITILSRCLQFNLKRLSEQQISNYLLELLSRENIELDSAAAAIIATAADGSMRDALSLLDQAIAYGGGKVELEAVREMLGTVDRGQVLSLLASLAAQQDGGDANDLWALAQSLQALSPDFSAVLDEMATCLQAVALKQVLPAAQSADDASMDAYQQQLNQLAAALNPENTQLFYQIVLHGKRDLPLAPQPRIGFEMTLLRLIAFQPSAQGTSNAPAGGTAPASPSPVSAAAPPAGPPPKSSLISSAENRAQPPEIRDVQPAAYPAAEPSSTKVSPLLQEVVAAPPASVVEPKPEVNSATPDTPLEPIADQVGGDFDWPVFVLQLNLRGLAKQLAANCRWVARNGNKVRLRISPEYAQIDNDRARLVVQEALATRFGQPDLQLSIEVGAVEPEASTSQPSAAPNPVSLPAEPQPAAVAAPDSAPEETVRPEPIRAEVRSPELPAASAVVEPVSEPIAAEPVPEPETQAPAEQTSYQSTRPKPQVEPQASPAAMQVARTQVEHSQATQSQATQSQTKEPSAEQLSAEQASNELDERLTDRTLGNTLAKREERVAVNAQQAARDAIEQDPNVIAMQAGMGASVRPGSIRPLNP